MPTALSRPALIFVCLLIFCYLFANCTAVNVCTPGTAQLCVCPDGSQGKRDCNQEGTYEPCQCTETLPPSEATPDASAVDTSAPDKPVADTTPEPNVDKAPNDASEPGSEPTATDAPDTSNQDTTTRETTPKETIAEQQAQGCGGTNTCPAGRGACIQGKCSCLYSKKLTSFEGHTGRAMDVSFSPNGKFVASVSINSNLSVWNPLSPKREPTYTHSAAREAKTVVFFPNNDLIVALGGGTRWPTVYSIKDKRNIMSLLGRGHSASTTDVAVSPDGKYAVTGALDGKLVLWDIPACVAGYEKEKKKPGYSGKATFCHSPSTQPAAFKALGSNPLALAYSKDGKMLAVSLETKQVRIYDTNQWKQTKAFPNLSDIARTVTFHPNGKNIVVGTDDGKIVLGDIASTKWTKTILNEDPLFTYKVHRVAVRPDGKYIASGWGDRTAKIHDFATGALVEVISEQFHDVFGIDFSADGKSLAIASGDKSVRVWGCR